VWGDDSLILAIGGAILNGFPGIVDWALLNDLIGCEANVGLVIRLGVRRLGIRLDLNGALVWWSAVGSTSGVISIILLNSGVISVSEDRGELPDLLVLTNELDSRLVWWSGVSLIGGVVTVCLLDAGIGSVVLD